MERDRYHPRGFGEMADDPTVVSLINEPVLPGSVGVIVPGQRRSLHSLLVQNLADVESLIARLEGGVGVADSGRALIRALYVACRRQREVLAAALRCLRFSIALGLRDIKRCCILWWSNWGLLLHFPLQSDSPDDAEPPIPALLRRRGKAAVFRRRPRRRR
jgi:hypothetical protein